MVPISLPHPAGPRLAVHQAIVRLDGLDGETGDGPAGVMGNESPERFTR